MTKRVPDREAYYAIQARRREVGPAFPRWEREGHPCERAGCRGVMYAYRIGETDAAVSSRAELMECLGRPPDGDSVAGEWFCTGRRRHTGMIGADEVWETEDDVW